MWTESEYGIASARDHTKQIESFIQYQNNGNDDDDDND